MNGQFTLRVRSPIVDSLTGEYRTLAHRENQTWDEICDHLKAMGDDFVVALVTNEHGMTVLRCQPTGMFGSALSGL